MAVIRINQKRLRRSFEEISRAGATEKGGVHRLALSCADAQARDMLKYWCGNLGYQVRTDRIGNMFARRPGLVPDLPPIIIGSHLDSQPMAGRFDGPVGVLAALEVLRTLDDRAITTRHPIELVNWTNEEGARFTPPLMGSGVFAGVHDLGFALLQKDSDGISVAQALEAIGYNGPVEVGGSVAAYFELHIEQGTVLETSQSVIGNVTGVVGIRDTAVTILGEDTHAGPMDMVSRRDALVGAAHMILAARQIGLAHAPEARVTIGRLNVPSNSHSVVPGRVDLVLDVRHPEAENLVQIQDELQDRFRRIADDCSLEVIFNPIWEYKPVLFDDRLRASIAQASSLLGYGSIALPSRAGHDAWNMARIAPSAMIFIPCRGGLSHNELEFAEEEHVFAGADVLLGALLAADERLTN